MIGYNVVKFLIILCVLTHYSPIYFKHIKHVNAKYSYEGMVARQESKQQ